MGLDMYLSAKQHASGGWRHVREDSARGSAYAGHEVKVFDSVLRGLGLTRVRNTRAGDSFDHTKPLTMNFAEVSVQVGYWRKAWAIHNWFVRNVQDGVDDCGSYAVDREMLTRLRDECVEILATVQVGPQDVDGVNGTTYDRALADDLIPVAEYSRDWYLQELEETRDLINAIFDVPQFGEYDEVKNPQFWTFMYQSSW